MSLCTHSLLVCRLDSFEAHCLYQSPLETMYLCVYKSIQTEKGGSDLMKLGFLSVSGFLSFLIKNECRFPSYNILCSACILSPSSSLPQSVCEVRGWSEVTEGRCFLPSFEDDCKDAGRDSGKGKACFPAEVGRFYEGGRNHKQQIQASFWQQLWKWELSFQPSGAATNPKCQANTSFGQSFF